MFPGAHAYTSEHTHTGPSGVVGSRHLQDRCDPAVNQYLEEAMPRDPEGGEGSQRFPEVPTAPHGGHTISQQLVSPSGTLFCFQMGSGTLNKQGFHRDHTMLGAAELPAPPSWPEPGLPQPAWNGEGLEARRSPDWGG